MSCTVLAACSTGDDAVGPTHAVDGTSEPSDAPSAAPSTTSVPEDLTSEDLALWEHTGAGRFVVERRDGEVVYRTEGGMGLLWLDRELSDFTISFEVQVSQARANSGVFLRIPQRPSDDSYVTQAFEVQIDTGGEGTSATGAIYSIQPPLVTTDLEPGVWHHVEISVHGPQIDVVIDGRAVNAFQVRTGGVVERFSGRGYLGLQNHADADTVWFRRIRLVDRSG